MYKLKKCPFCGGIAKRYTITNEDEVANVGGDVICCTQCGFSTAVFFGEKEGLEEAWNNRVKDNAIRNLEAKISFQKQEIAGMQSTLKTRTKALDAMSWVWCTGGCDGGVFQKNIDQFVTQEMIDIIENNLNELKTWYTNYNFKKEWNNFTPEEKQKWFDNKLKKQENVNY